MNSEQLRALLLQDPKRVFVGTPDDYRNEFGVKPLPRDFRELEPGTYDWGRYTREYPERQEEMLRWKKETYKPKASSSLSGGLAIPSYQSLKGGG